MALRTFLATLLCASALAACSATQAADQLGATCDQLSAAHSIQQSTSVAAAEDVQVVLCSNPTTGFSWEDPQIADASVARLISATYQAPATASLPIIGAAGGEIVTIHALAAGTTTLSMRYSQPWAGGTKGAWTYTLAITVE
jgi:predicted secreted protein